VTSELADLLVCPSCQVALTGSDGSLSCGACGRSFPVVDGIPVLLVDTADHNDAQKQRQAGYFDQEDPEFETTRPHGAPALYGWLLGEKFRRSVAAVRGALAGSVALTVCGGSGMDAEFLARAGARVISSDLSLGAAKRAAERARRYGLAVEPVVADVERLPFPDCAFDLVYVHDGLHHLERPAAGISEMARVAEHVVSVNEPARAAATALAVRLGLALEQEDAGNRVARLTLEEVADELSSRGYRIVAAERYAMRYAHHPGLAARWLSSAPLFPVARLGLRALNVPLGRFGNKLTVQAVRNGTPAIEGDQRQTNPGGEALCL
jgi:SAM-dependent methyltransferase